MWRCSSSFNGSRITSGQIVWSYAHMISDFFKMDGDNLKTLKESDKKNSFEKNVFGDWRKQWP